MLLSSSQCPANPVSPKATAESLRPKPVWIGGLLLWAVLQAFASVPAAAWAADEDPGREISVASLSLKELMRQGHSNLDDWYFFRNAFQVGEDAIFDLWPKSHDHRRNAQDCFREILAREPENLDAFLRLFLIYRDSGEIGEIEGLLASYPEVWSRDPDDYHTDLFRGLLLQSLYRYVEADSAYGRALERMPSREKARYESLEAILSSRQKKDYRRQLDDGPQKAGETEYERKFWLSKDPLYLSETNERELEHYRRLAYADIRFGEPFEDRPGQATDRGRIYVRYGEPRETAVILPYHGIRSLSSFSEEHPEDSVPSAIVTAKDRQGELSPRLREEIYRAFTTRNIGGYYDDVVMADGDGKFMVGREIWNYDNFVFTFFDWGEKKRYKMYSDRENDPPTVINETPELYEPAFGGETINIEGYYATFRGDEGRTLLDVSYAIPTDRIERKPTEGEWLRADFDHGTFIFDSDWNQVYRAAKRESILIRSGESGLPDRLVVDGNYDEFEPGTYTLSVEIQDRASRNTGISRQELEVPEYGYDKLLMSDLIVGLEITPKQTVYRSRRDLNIRGNPSRLFGGSQLLYLYYEIYNLREDRDGRTSYRVETTVAEPREDRRGALGRFFHNAARRLRLVRENVYIGLSSDYRGLGALEARVETIDINSLLPGRYRLNIRTTDLVTDRSVDRDFIFFVAGETAPEEGEF